jgi:hypothetical protein
MTEQKTKLYTLECYPKMSDGCFDIVHLTEGQKEGIARILGGTRNLLWVWVEEGYLGVSSNA